MLNLESPPTTCASLTAQLFDVLNRQELVYCHWKSNERLDEGLRGETDLDLLVSRDSFDQAIAVLLNLGFKQAHVIHGVATPGVLHFYAFDPDLDDLIHVHLYCRMMTGESLVKTHILPLDGLLLNETERRGEIQVPARDAEAAVYVLRNFIKSGSLLHSVLHDRGGDPSEFWFPHEGVDADAAFVALSQYDTGVDRALFKQCFEALRSNQPWSKRWKLGRKVRRRVRGWQRFSNIARLRGYRTVILNKLWRMANGRMNNKTLQSGGAVIAFIGGDATGKSTLVNATKDWLGKKLAVRCVHVGKPRSSWVTMPLDALLPVARRCFPGQRHQSQQAIESKAESFNESRRSYSILYAMRAVTLAWNRSRLLRTTHRRAAKGDIVICDRFPADEPGCTDGPRLRITESQSWFMRSLARLEQRLYSQHPSPDIAIRLHVSLETAKERNRVREKSDKHSEEDLEIRHRNVAHWSRRGIKSLHDISTEPPLQQTFRAVQDAIWESL